MSMANQGWQWLMVHSTWGCWMMNRLIVHSGWKWLMDKQPLTTIDIMVPTGFIAPAVRSHCFLWREAVQFSSWAPEPWAVVACYWRSEPFGTHVCRRIYIYIWLYVDRMDQLNFMSACECLHAHWRWWMYVHIESGFVILFIPIWIYHQR